ncbi:hypothetical protein LzC2_02800 [Planctomycetes bacterium LzC2]|uniref:HEAT repeat domain-containing protein n=2 Tax=Alienimonas chondri TaxID=2681879 RepID=A0ABX1V8W1_9PLAN|nr:hypothetical protein [Alienimonas chondri]
MVAAALAASAGCDGAGTLVGETPQGAPVASSNSSYSQSTPATRNANPGVGFSSNPTRVRDDAPRSASSYAKEIENGRRAFENSLDANEKRLAATVIVTDIGYAEGEPAFLYEQLRKAASQFYSEQTSGSRAATEANRKRAEQEAVKGSAGFGPVWYNYEIVEAEIGRSRVVAGPTGDKERVYYLFPVSDLGRVEAAAHGVEQVSVDSSSRSVTLRSVLPGVLPDGEPDKLADLYPPEKQVRVVVKYDTSFGSDSDRQAWIKKEAGAPDMSPEGDRLLSVAKHRWLSTSDQITLSVAPVEDVEAYKERIEFGDVTDFDANARVIQVVAKIPADVKELARGGSGMRSSSGVASDREPAPGEAETIWAARVLRNSDDYWARKEAIKHLARTLPEEATEQERAVVGEALLFSMRAPERMERDDLSSLLITWRPDGYADMIRKQIEGSDLWHNDKEKLLRKLADVDDPAAKKAAAEAAVAVADERWMGEAAVDVLRDLGAAAEDAVIDRLTDPDPKVRADVATLLGEIGTEKSADRLLAQSKLETDRALAKHMRTARGNVNRRLMAGSAAGDDR